MPAGDPSWTSHRAHSSPIVSGTVIAHLPPRPMASAAARSSPRDRSGHADAWDHPMREEWGDGRGCHRMKHPAMHHQEHMHQDGWQPNQGPASRRHRSPQQPHANGQQPHVAGRWPDAFAAAERAASAPVQAEFAEAAVPIAHQVFAPWERFCATVDISILADDNGHSAHNISCES